MWDHDEGGRGGRGAVHSSTERVLASNDDTGTNWMLVVSAVCSEYKCSAVPTP